MALETGTNVGDLVVTNPTASDPKSQGDDHLRLIKAALRQSFAGWTAAVIVTGTNGGVVNAYTLTPATTLLAYTSPMIVVFIPSITNTGAATINVSALGAKSLKSVSGAALTSGELVAGCIYVAAYDGTNFNLVAPTKAYIDALAFNAALPFQTGHAASYVRTDGSTAAWATFSASAAQVRAGTATDAALTPGDTYAGLAEVALTSSGGSIAADMSTFVNGFHQMTENTTIANPTNSKVGQSGYILVRQHASAAKTLAFANTWKRVGGALAIGTTLSGYSVIEYQVNSAFITYEILNNPS